MDLSTFVMKIPEALAAQAPAAGTRVISRWRPGARRRARRDVYDRFELAIVRLQLRQGFVLGIAQVRNNPLNLSMAFSPSIVVDAVAASLDEFADTVATWREVRRAAPRQVAASADAVIRALAESATSVDPGWGRPLKRRRFRETHAKIQETLADSIAAFVDAASHDTASLVARVSRRIR